jgi:hypothetical protein
MSSFRLNFDPRDAQYARLASNILRVLKLAVGTRVANGATQAQISDRLGWKKGQLSRIVNGRVSNITIRTFSDVLWACDFEPSEITADPLELLVSGAEEAYMRDFVWSTSGREATNLVHSGQDSRGSATKSFNRATPVVVRDAVATL